MIIQALLLLAVTVGAALADGTGEWARFRGPNGSGVAEVSGLPVEFGPTRNLLWKTDLPQGYSSPIVDGNRIFLTGVRDGRLVSFTVDRTTGKVLWDSKTTMKAPASPGSFYSALSQVYVGTNDGTLHAFGFLDERR